jgi:hypothetical protein
MKVEINSNRKQTVLSVIEQVLESESEGRITFQKNGDMFSIFATSEVETILPS